MYDIVKTVKGKEHKTMTKAQIMKRAWEIKKEDSRYIFGLCLKMAWAEAKEMEEKKEFTGFAKVERVDSMSGNDDASFYTFKAWEGRNGQKRIYVNDYKKRTVGFVNLADMAIVTEYSQRSGQYQTIQKFMSEYAF